MDAEKLKLGFIGAGSLARSLSAALARKGFTVTAVASRSLASARIIETGITDCRAFASLQEAAGSCDLVFITTPDSAIAEVASKVEWRPGQMVVHTSGADSADLLKPAADMGAATGVFHPLQTLTGTGRSGNPFRGITITIEGAKPLLDVLCRIAERLEADPLELKPEARVLYHASAVIASNYLTALASLACRLWQEFGYRPERALQSLLPLMRGAVTNLEQTGLPECLTGPISRGDIATINRHLQALDETFPLHAGVYRSLGLATLDIARQKECLLPGRAGEIEHILTDKENHHANNHAEK
ncbi:MAG: DUF2520 domain-containing protein [Dehalococcoidaceae bacterium]|nr:DUF2520 domain-containing protein [Dehalococcoidaceae bacterium]